MMNPNVNDRRHFLAGSAAILASPMAFRRCAAEDKPTSPGRDRNPICVFTKPFNSISFDELADVIANLGFNGIEAPVRAGGHVEPNEVEDKLPELVEALKKRDLEITVLTSDVNDPDDPLTARVLRTAATLGIKRYRMKYYRYDLGKNILGQIDQWRPKLKQLAAMNHDFGLTGLYQNHAGANYMGASLWDLKLALQGIPTSDIAVAYDIRHATAEAGMSWPTTFKMIRPFIDTVYVKDFEWTDNKRPNNVPLGTGRIDPQFFSMLRDTNFLGPISLHEEYLDHKDPKLVPKHLAAIQNDLKTLRHWLSGR